MCLVIPLFSKRDETEEFYNDFGQGVLESRQQQGTLLLFENVQEFIYP